MQVSPDRRHPEAGRASVVVQVVLEEVLAVDTAVMEDDCTVRLAATLERQIFDDVAAAADGADDDAVAVCRTAVETAAAALSAAERNAADLHDDRASSQPPRPVAVHASGRRSFDSVETASRRIHGL